MAEVIAPVCYVTTVGRVSGKQHRIEIWYLERNEILYLLSGGGERADWVQNIRAHPGVEVELPPPAAAAFAGTRSYTAEPGPFVDERDVREAMDARYRRWLTGQPLSSWAVDSLVVRLSPS